jgi:soluble lytic murein transglycosylase-like protein
MHPGIQGRDWPTRKPQQTHRMNLTNLITALIAVESGGNDMAIGDNGKAIGPLQIHRAVVVDVNRITGSHYRHQDMTNRAQARAVCEAYLRHYGRGATTEQLARRWNGGPTGDRKTATEAYWAKVKKQMK